MSDELPFHFRTAVILGCIALLVGVAGIFVFQRADERERLTHPSEVCTVVVQGLEAGREVQVIASWLDEESEERRETGKPAGEPGYWFFYRAPAAEPVTLEVIEQAGDTRRVLYAGPARLTRGGLFTVWIRDGN